jgi:O-6-methylguanine DNA methyltransferase
LCFSGHGCVLWLKILELQLTLKGEEYMASLNDNLFTTLLRFAMSCEGRCLLPTRLGRMHLRFTERGLASLVFVDELDSVLDTAGPFFAMGSGRHSLCAPAEGGRSCERALAALFLDWLEVFEAAPPAMRWQYFDLDGTDFQKSVWRALLELPFAGSVTYGQLARHLGRPRASRAVGSAVGANHVAVLLPCHRVLPQAGGVGHYRWGAARKRALLEAEQIVGSGLSALF